MKNLFAFLLLIASAQAQLLAMGKQAVTLPTVVQSGLCATTTATCSVTFGQAVGAGNYLICYEGGTGNGTGATCTMTGETITKQSNIASRCPDNTGIEGDCFVSTNTVGGQTVITCLMSTGSDGSCAFVELTSPSGGHAIDVGGHAHSGTTAVSVATSAVSTNANDICVGMAYNSTGSPGFSALNWTSILSGAGGVNTGGAMLMEYKVPGATGTQTATATGPGTNIAEGVICLKP